MHITVAAPPKIWTFPIAHVGPCCATTCLTGTKIAAEAECGLCTVLVNSTPVNSHHPAFKAQGAIVTVEEARRGATPFQRAFVSMVRCSAASARPA